MEMQRREENERLKEDRRRLSEHTSNMYNFQNRVKKEIKEDSDKMYDELFNKYLDENPELLYNETSMLYKFVEFLKAQ